MSAERRARLLALLAVYDGVEGVLHGICALCEAELAVSGARVRVLGGIGAVLPRDDALAARLDEVEAVAGQGPSVDAFDLGRPVLVPDLATDTGRWHAFTPDAVALGVAAVFAFPLLIGASRFGVLTLHRRTAGPLTPDQLLDAFLLADAATSAIFDDLHGPPATTLPDLLDIHPEVHQASGIVAVQLDIGVADALARIRAHAFANRLPLAEVATKIIERRLRLDSGE
ncbi:GAF and ANTAR domain-containing protein [Actinokineospora sp. HUAS TT18]|uniref:GAF and ANTAR domain-containing protein n=1 Tax=Actinokineospora sp. HUAS TT18 TaxID=3447451 RepID=UPI003F51F94C